MKTIKTDVVIKKGAFINEHDQNIEYVNVFIVVNGIELKLKPSDSTCKAVLLAYVGKD